MPETLARRALRGQNVLLRVLGPVGAYAGRGVLRVLRLRPAGDAPSTGSGQAIELVCGYESYEPLDGAPRLRSGPFGQGSGLDTSR